MQSLFVKPKNMRWVDLAIWIDENFYKEDCDYDTAYTYMYLLASMLASKRRYFETRAEYEEFASYLACETFNRMSNPDKSNIKSVLNYMKSIMSFRRMGFNQQRRQKIIDPEYDQGWDSAAYVENCKDAYESTFKESLYEGVCETLSLTPTYIDKCIPKVYKCDKILYKNIYISCLLSMINSITLPKIIEEKFKEKLDKYPFFNETKYFSKHRDNGVILWHISKTYQNVVRVILNKVNRILIDEIKTLSNDIRVSSDEFNNIMFSGIGGERNETNY